MWVFDLQHPATGKFQSCYCTRLTLKPFDCRSCWTCVTTHRKDVVSPVSSSPSVTFFLPLFKQTHAWQGRSQSLYRRRINYIWTENNFLCQYPKWQTTRENALSLQNITPYVWRHCSQLSHRYTWVSVLRISYHPQSAVKGKSPKQRCVFKKRGS